ncbi:hypothetical protein BTJ68_11429 [Hortaea werneckii EXF-2000]|uniref:Uncharacterized protein n=1 Tax=Hortaea werneckii EXF-2000 TaxID=1157616 RepID=A0A1Z5SWG4_HORWE|nr:hypothetical protein BTJ68_11429 [Hortaea werneckii EXF-2000]
MEYEKTYVFKPGERPSKRRRVEPKGLQSSWKLRQAAYQEAWREQQSKDRFYSGEYQFIHHS